MKIITSIVLDDLDCTLIHRALVHFASDMQVGSNAEAVRIYELVDQIIQIRKGL